MGGPSFKTILTAAFALCIIGWLYSLKRMNSPELESLEKNSKQRDFSKLKLALSEHPDLESFRLINNGPLNLALFVEILNSDGSIDFMQNARIASIDEKDTISGSVSFELWRKKSSDVNQNMVNVQYQVQSPHGVGIVSLMKAVPMGNYCLCEAETYEEMKNETKSSPIVTLCKEMNYTFFTKINELRQYSSSRYLCGIKDKPSLRGPAK